MSVSWRRDATSNRDVDLTLLSASEPRLLWAADARHVYTHEIAQLLPLFPSLDVLAQTIRGRHGRKDVAEQIGKKSKGRSSAF